MALVSPGGWYRACTANLTAPLRSPPGRCGEAIIDAVRLRPPAPDDAASVFAVMRERDVADFATADCALEDVLEEWRASDFDPSADARVCEDEEGRIQLACR